MYFITDNMHIIVLSNERLQLYHCGISVTLILTLLRFDNLGSSIDDDDDDYGDVDNFTKTYSMQCILPGHR